MASSARLNSSVCEPEAMAILRVMPPEKELTVCVPAWLPCSGDDCFMDRLLVPHHAPAALGTGRRRPVGADSVVRVGRPALLAWVGCLLWLGCLASCCSWEFALAQRANHEVRTSLFPLRSHVQWPSRIAAAAWSAPFRVPPRSQLSSSRSKRGSLAILRKAVCGLVRSLGS